MRNFMAYLLYFTEHICVHILEIEYDNVASTGQFLL
jgi:hypothetical protein